MINRTLSPTRPTPELEKFNDNAVIYRYFYITITDESFLITNEN